ncbi:MAG: peptidase in kexin sedolisin [Clostridiaceae bacterium]|jgi:minor extracellular protease Epr|nr:peptidase in kexin sedolisin [Clostridiaceae bacterium]
MKNLFKLAIMYLTSVTIIFTFATVISYAYSEVEVFLDYQIAKSEIINKLTTDEMKEITYVSTVYDKDKFQSESWGYERIIAENTLKNSLTGKGVKVAIIDTGIDLNHPDLIVAGGVSMVDYTTSYNDDNGHGTHMAGIISAQDNNTGHVGIAPGASIYAIKALNSKGDGYVLDIIKGIYWAIDNDMDIINMSLGDSKIKCEEYEKAVNLASEKGIIVITCSGNEGNALHNEDKISSLAKYAGAIAVSSIDKNDNIANFSSTGKEVDFTAPGVDIASTFINSSYEAHEGTSISSAYVTGTFALIKEAMPDATREEIMEIAKNSATDLGEEGKDNKYGYGIIEIPNLIKTLREYYEL